MIDIRQIGQGLLSVRINNKPTDWKIQNTNGVWNLYRTEPSLLKFEENLASVIHKDELKNVVAELIRGYEE